MVRRRKDEWVPPDTRYYAEPLHPEWEDTVPRGFWQDVDNHRRFMTWLGQKLGYRKLDDWYRVRQRDFIARGGRSLLAGYYGNSPSAAVMAMWPAHDWKPWLFVTTPQGFWRCPANRRAYLHWLGERLGFRRPEDWLRISTQHFKDNFGGTVIQFWGSSAIAAVKELYPRRQWHEWLFEQAPQRFWKDRRNHGRYLAWLAKQLRILRPEDWYHVSNVDFARHAGSAFLLEYRSTISQALIKCLPEHDLKEWLFEVCPQRFWRNPANRRRYLKWLGEQLGYRRAKDWYQLTTHILDKHHGNGLRKVYRDSVFSIVRELYPRRVWHEWLFSRTSAGFWNKPENRRAYLDWLGKKLRFRGPEDWQRLRAQDLKRNFGGAIWTAVDSLQGLLAEYLPERFKDAKRAVKPLTKQQILDWADRHHRRKKAWPNKQSGAIPWTGETWYKVDVALRDGFRGLPGKETLASLLAAERGARNPRQPPPLSLAQVREWIEAWHSRTGNWPNCRRGKIPNSNGETWSALGNAMSRGTRGLPCGPTLERFVELVRAENA